MEPVYNKIVAIRLEELKDSIEKIKLLNDDVNLALEIMPDAHVWLDYEVNIHWPVKSMDDVKEVLKEFAKKHILLDHFVESEISPTWYLKGINSKIRLSPQWYYDSEEGVTCRLVKVGEDTRTYPKYKLVCDEEKDTSGHSDGEPYDSRVEDR
uniref:Uncharacterized protein n=1 Tax=viral metagenome TaxID=1070528 RepID=A0A6M3KJD4_9ZZZZ